MSVKTSQSTLPTYLPISAGRMQKGHSHDRLDSGLGALQATGLQFLYRTRHCSGIQGSEVLSVTLSASLAPSIYSKEVTELHICFWETNKLRFSATISPQGYKGRGLAFFSRPHKTKFGREFCSRPAAATSWLDKACSVLCQEVRLGSWRYPLPHTAPPSS